MKPSDANQSFAVATNPWVGNPHTYEPHWCAETWLRGNDQDREAEAPEAVLPEVSAEPLSEAAILPWRGHENVIAAAGTLLLDLLERA